MKIAVSSGGEDLKALLDPRFGRCNFFAIYDEKDEKWGFLPNPGASEGSGAGIKAAQFLTQQKIDVLLTGNLGPNAINILNAAGITAYSLPEISIAEALQQYRDGRCKLISEATVKAHAGMRPGSSQEVEQSENVAVPPSKGKVAIATDGREVAQHFGRCPAYTLIELGGNGDEVINKTVIDNPGHQPGFLPRFLAARGVSCVIAGGMGPRAQGLFAEQGIRTIIGVTGLVEDAIASYLSGNLSGGESLCEHGQNGHDHSCEGH